MAMPSIPRKGEIKTSIDFDGEKLKVIKKFANQELDELDKALPSAWSKGRKRFLKFVLESKSCVGLPIESMPEAVKTIRVLPFMDDHSLPSIYDDAEYWKRTLSQIFPLRYPEDQIKEIRLIQKTLQERLKEARRRIANYRNSQGAASRAIRQGNIERTLKVLGKCGGIAGYGKLPRGGKKSIRAEIEKRCTFKDERNVYNMLRIIRGL
jgi:hypothetical protein